MLVLIHIDQYQIINSSFLQDQYYLELKNSDKSVYYIINHEIYLVEKIVLIESNIYLVNLKFNALVHPIFFQIEKNISLMSYLFAAIFNI